MKNRILTLSVLLLLLLSVCFSTFSVMSGREISWGMVARNFLYNAPPFLLMGAVDYWVVCRMRPRGDSGLTVWNILAATFLVPLAVGGIGYFVASWAALPFDFPLTVLPTMLCNGIIVLVLGIYMYGRQQMESSRRLALMERERMSYQYEALKSQINPHFLFNSLNVLASLAYSDAVKANLFAKRMAEVYRYLLTTQSRPTVSLEEEMRFVGAYIYLYKIRFGEAIRMEISDGGGAYAGRQVIPASLQILVENAVKHNVSSLKSPLVIKITADDRGITVSNNLQLRGYVPKSGTGLENLRRQYGLHGKSLTVVQTSTDFMVEIPFL